MKLRNNVPLFFATAILAVLSLVVLMSTPSSAAVRHRTQAPGNLSATVTRTTATLSWNPPPGRINAYKVARDGHDSTGGGFYSATISPTRHSFTFTLLIPGSIYHLYVAAHSAAGGWSQTVFTTVRLPGGAPAPKLNLSVDVQAINSLQPYGQQYDSSGPGSNQGGYDCVLGYHQYFVTKGCGGAWAIAHVTGLASFRNGLSSSGTVNVYADISRTFGCVDQGRFTPDAVVRDSQVQFSWVHGNGNFSPTNSESPTSNNMTIATFVNEQPYAPVPTCGAQYHPERKIFFAQLGVKVSNLKIVVDDPVFGERTATIPGPWYSPAESF